MKALPDIKKELKEVLQEGIDVALTTLKSVLADSTDKFNDLVLLEGRYRAVNQQLLQGIISYEDAQLEFNKIRKSILDFIESMEETHLKGKAAAPDGKPDVYNGEVFYRIPGTMQIDEEVKCLIRVAFTRQALMKGLEQEKGDVLKDIRISDVMGVELIDPESTPAFAIRTFSEPVQFVEKDLPTEWFFYVKPLREGHHSLVLKISVVEIKDGIERKRNVVLEESVVIVAEPVPEEEEGKELQKAGYALNFAAAAATTKGKAAGGSKGPQPALPMVEITQKSRKPQAPSPKAPRKASTGKMRKVAAVFPVLLIFIVAAWAIWPYMTSDSSEEKENASVSWKNIADTGNKNKLADFIKKFPNSDEAAQARQKLDSFDNVSWESALVSDDPDRLRKYLEEYPGGIHVAEAIAELDEQPVAIETTPGPRHNDPQLTAPDSIESGSSSQQETATNGITPNESPEDVPVPWRSAARKPVYPKCDNDNKKKEEDCTDKKIGWFISKKLEYPKEALRKRIEGTITVAFVVEKDGSVTKVKPINEIGGGCGKEAVRLVGMLPRFKPGRNANGDPVRIQYYLPIKFKLR